MCPEHNLESHFRLTVFTTTETDHNITSRRFEYNLRCRVRKRSSQPAVAEISTRHIWKRNDLLRSGALRIERWPGGARVPVERYERTWEE